MVGVAKVHVSDHAQSVAGLGGCRCDCGAFLVRLVLTPLPHSHIDVSLLLLLSWILFYCRTSFQFLENHQAAVFFIERLRDWGAGGGGGRAVALPKCGYS